MINCAEEKWDRSISPYLICHQQFWLAPPFVELLLLLLGTYRAIPVREGDSKNKDACNRASESFCTKTINISLVEDVSAYII